MCNSNYSNIVLQQERIHVDGILTARERGITCVVRLGNENAQVYYLIWRKRPFPQLQRAEVLKWSQGLANLGLFEGKDTSSFTYQPCHCPQARVFCCWHGRKTPLGFLIPGSNDKYRSKSFLFHKKHSEGSELPRIQDCRRESLPWRMCWDGAILGN